MAKLSTWSTTAASNNLAVPEGWPEGMSPSNVNNVGRQTMARLRAWYEDAEWLELGHTINSASGTDIVLAGDVSAFYPVGRTCRADSVVGYVTAVVVAANTTVTVSGITFAGAPTTWEVGILKTSFTRTVGAFTVNGLLTTAGLMSSSEITGSTSTGAVAVGLMSAAFNNDTRAFVGWRNTGSPFSGSAGSLILQARSSAAADIIFVTGTTTAADRGRILSSGRWLVGTSTDDGSNLLQVAGNLALIGASRKIKAQFDTSNNLIFENSVANATTRISVAPSGTGTTSQVVLFNSSDTINTTRGIINLSSTNFTIQTDAIGTGAAKDLLLNVSGTTAQIQLTTGGNTIAGSLAALATTATDGFFYVPTCAGAPTGTPTSVTGKSPIVIDTTNNRLYFYSTGAWRNAGP